MADLNLWRPDSTLASDQGVRGGAVLDTGDISSNQNLRDRGTFVKVKHPVRGEFVIPGFPVKMSGSKVPVVAAPVLGADTERIYHDLLGMEPGQIAELRKEEAI